MKKGIIVFIIAIVILIAIAIFIAIVNRPIELLEDVKFDPNTLKLDLGVNWDKYYFGSFPRESAEEYKEDLEEGMIYIPSQRYLSYQYITDNYDIRNGRDEYDFCDWDETTTVVVVPKDDFTKSKTIEFSTPFSVSFVKEEGDRLNIEADAANGIKSMTATLDNQKSSYQTESGNLNIPIPTEEDFIRVIITDLYGNEYKTSAEYNGQYFIHWR